MNQRIFELAKQAGAWEYYEINEGVDGDEKPLEKFAELIVRECMTVARKADGLDAEYEAWYLIKQHFGVE